MKAIEVKKVDKVDKVVFDDQQCEVMEKSLNDVLIRFNDGSQRIVSYSQIEKYEQNNKK
jgi:hypothetical protein